MTDNDAECLRLQGAICDAIGLSESEGDIGLRTTLKALSAVAGGLIAQRPAAEQCGLADASIYWLGFAMGEAARQLASETDAAPEGGVQ